MTPVPHWVRSRLNLRYFLRRCYAEGLSKALVSALAGRTDGLASERTYVTRTLTGAVRDALVEAVRGPARLDALRRSAAVIAGVAAASVGFVQGTLAHRKRQVPLGPAPSVHRDQRIRD